MNFNPYFNQSMYNNPYMRGNPTPIRNPYMNNVRMPFNTPTMRQPNSLASSSLLKGGKSLAKPFTFSKFLDGTQNVIATVNSAIPIYEQVKPLFANSKIVTGAIKKVFTNKSNTTSRVTPSQSTPIHTENKVVSEEKTNFKEQNTPNRPFF